MAPLPLAVSQSKKALAALADFLSAHGVALREADGAKAARLDALKRKLEQRKATAADVASVSFELMVWQLGQTRERYAAQLAPIAAAAATGHGPAKDAKAALESLLGVLDRALLALREKNPPAEVSRGLQAELQRVEKLVAKARQSLSRSTAGVPLRPLAQQPVSSTGVRLTPSAPVASKTPAALASFKLRPGALPASARR